MRFNSSKFQEAVKSLIQKLLQVMDVATAVKQCKNFIESADITKFEVQNLQRNCNILIDKGKLLLELCDRLIQYCSQDHEQQNRLTINNEIQRLRQRINEYRTEINHLIIKIKDYGSKLAEDIKTARRRESKVDNAKIVQGVGVTGSALAFMVGLLVGGPLGGTVAVGSIIYGGLRAKKCVEAHSAVQGVVKIREDYETTMNKTEQWYWELCQQQVDVENSFARCQQLVEDF